jgi:hypothetical protein
MLSSCKQPLTWDGILDVLFLPMEMEEDEQTAGNKCGAELQGQQYSNPNSTPCRPSVRVLVATLGI